MKYTRFADIPMFISAGNWECHFDWRYLQQTLDTWDRDYGLDLDPDFQRGHVWTRKQQTEWIEFALRGGRSSRVLYFNCPAFAGQSDSTDPMVLVDGKQRLEAIRGFMSDEIPAFGSLYSEYTDNPCMIRQGYVLINMNILPTRAEVLEWYIQFNTGGTPHTDEEIDRVRQLLAAERGHTR